MDTKRTKNAIKGNVWAKTLIYYPYQLTRRIIKFSVFFIQITFTVLILLPLVFYGILIWIYYFFISLPSYIKKKHRNNILFLVEGNPSKGLSPATRFRVHQYIPYLENDGFRCKVSPSSPYKYFTAHFRFRELRRKFPHLAIVWARVCLTIMIINRIRDILISKGFDIVFLQRDLIPIPTLLLEKWVKRFNSRIIFDFDDAIFLRPSWCKTNPEEALFDRNLEKKFSQIIRLSSWVIAANDYLRNFAKKINSNASVILTPIDIKRYFPQSNKKKSSRITVGWIGTSGNLYYLNNLTSVFKELFIEFKELRLKVICDFVVAEEYPILKLPQVIFKVWSLEDELEYLHSLDIGIMPLADDEWTKGKAGFKIIQYMALGIPVVASPVGFNRELISDRVNGFFAKKSQDWVKILSLLIKNEKLRLKIGDTGRNFVERNCSIEVTYPKLLKIFKELMRS